MTRPHHRSIMNSKEGDRITFTATGEVGYGLGGSVFGRDTGDLVLKVGCREISLRDIANYADSATRTGAVIRPLDDAEPGEMWQARYKAKTVLFRIPDDDDVLIRISGTRLSVVDRTWWQGRATNWKVVADYEGNLV